MVALRIIHIEAGVFWAGSMIFVAFYLAPAVGRAERARLGTEMSRLRTRAARAGQAVAWLLILAVVTMAAARYV